MNIIYHAILSILIGIIAFAFPPYVIAFTLGGTLIDIDHYFYAAFRNKTLSLKINIEYLKKEYKVHRPHLYLFHTFEFLVTFGILTTALDNKLFYIFFAGLVFHQILDILSYLYIYKSTKPWMQSMFLAYYFQQKPTRSQRAL